MEQISTAPEAWWSHVPCPLCLRGLAQGVEQTHHFWHEPFFNLGDANTVSSRPGLWVPAKLFWDHYPPVRTQSPGSIHCVHLRFSMVREASQISGILDVFGLLLLFF